MEITEPIKDVEKSVELKTCSGDRDSVQENEHRLFSAKSLVELSKSSWSPTEYSKDTVQPYLRGSKWSPDGTCCLAVVNNDGVHVLELPRDLYDGDLRGDRPIDILNSVIHVKEAGLIYDFCWFPGMNSSYPETCSWLTTRQNGPVQMWDAFDGSLRCTYRGYNAVDEMEPALTVTFSHDGTKIIAGYKKFLRTFETDRPGRDFSEHSVKYPASCFAINNEILAVGSWNSSISLYNMSEMGGVTHMKFTTDGLHLVSGARKDDKLLVWDIRYCTTPINILQRVVRTNQRIYFDISPCGKYLVTGNTDGSLKVWDSEYYDWKSGIEKIKDDPKLCDDGSFRFPLHYDCCNSVSIHPCRPILATGSGQYHFQDPEVSTDLDAANETHVLDGKMLSEDNNSSVMKIDAVNMRNGIINKENSLVFWWTDVVANLDI
ncbi:Telomerase Cajal body protein 1 [Eumeta japonica]|uniref:WD repeat-containing protein 79 n=1 Tax=Eumeta variegata TaxID=151549 RepID=A0A4C1XZM6_EUMVA|nr:Telomerase Cajal body protein 1 [Eumeta japonica]